MILIFILIIVIIIISCSSSVIIFNMYLHKLEFVKNYEHTYQRFVEL